MKHSIEHPEYRYPESFNPYWKKVQELKGLIYSDNATEEHRGEWRSKFPASARDASPSSSLSQSTRLHVGSPPNSAGGVTAQRRPLHVEIGCNAGHVLVEWAAQNPEALYIGLDWKFKAIHRAAEKVAKRKLANAIFFRAHAIRMPWMFGPGEIDHLYLFFPDPWPKKSQKKNRFLTEGELRKLAPLVREGGTFEIRTDHPDYFEWMEDAVSKVGDIWQVKTRTVDRHKDHPLPTSLQIPQVTLFEKLFIKDGIKIQSLGLVRRA